MEAASSTCGSSAGVTAWSSSRPRLGTVAERRDSISTRSCTTKLATSSSRAIAVKRPTRASTCCAGVPKDTLLGFGGAIPARQSRSRVRRGHFRLSLPSVWGADASKTMRGRPSVATRDAATSGDRALREGVVGSTSFVQRVEPGACYVAAVAAVRGMPRGIVLRARVGATEALRRTRHDRRRSARFVLHRRRRTRSSHGRITRGTAVAWGLALFHVTSGGWEREP